MAASLAEVVREPAPGGPGSAANPPAAGPGATPGNVTRTAAQADPGSVGGGTIARPERYLLVVRVRDRATGAGPSYAFARWPDWPHPAMLSMAPPHPDEGLETAVAALLASRTGLRAEGVPRVSERRVPARMSHPRTGVEGLGWLRPVAVDASGEPSPDALLAGVALLDAEEARSALPTDVERIIFEAGLVLLG